MKRKVERRNGSRNLNESIFMDMEQGYFAERTYSDTDPAGDLIMSMAPP